jgi:hypothetical protein
MKQLKIFWIINALAMLVSATAVNGAPPEIVVALPSAYEFAGYTKQLTGGGDQGGVVGMNALCQQDFGERARMCTTTEWRETKKATQPPPENGRFAWAQPDIIAVYKIFDDDFIAYLEASYNVFHLAENKNPADILSCNQWRSSDELLSGYGVVDDEETPTYVVLRSGCAEPEAVACCAPALITPIVVK